MHKTVTAVLFSLAVLLLATAVLAADGVDIIQTSISAIGVSGMLPLSFTVNNTGNTSANITFSATLLTNSSSNFTLTPVLPNPLQNVSPGNSTDVSAQVNVTSAPAGTYTGTLRAHVNAVQDSIPVTVTVLSNGLSIIRVGSGSITLIGDAGQTVSGTVTLRNERNEPLTVTVNTAVSFTATASQTVQFAAFEEKNIAFSVSIPSSTAAGSYVGTVTMVVGGSTVVSVPLSVTVNPTSRITAPASVSVSADMGTNRTSTFTITNNGNQDLNNLQITFSTASFTDDDGDAIGVTLSPASNISLAVGASRLITVTANVPADIDPQTYSGTMTVSGNGLSQNIPLSIAVTNILEITDVKVRVSGRSSERKVSPGETFTVEVEVENTADDIDLEDVEVEVFFEDSSGDRLEDDSGDDLDDDAELQDLDADENDEVTFTFVMPNDADDGDTFNVVVIATAKNVRDSSQRFTARDESEEIEVDKEEHDLAITRASLDQSTLSCDRLSNLRVTVENRGDEDEDVDLLVQNSALGISYSRSFNLDRDSRDPDFEVTEIFPIEARNAQPGSYQISIIARYDGRSKAANALLTVNECGRTPYQSPRDGEPDGEPSEPGRGSSPIQVRYDNVPTQPPTSPDFTLRKADSGFTNDALLTILLILANLVMIVVVIGGIMKLAKRR